MPETKPPLEVVGWLSGSGHTIVNLKDKMMPKGNETKPLTAKQEQELRESAARFGGYPPKTYVGLGDYMHLWVSNADAALATIDALRNRLTALEPGSLEACMNAVFEFAEKECGHKAHSSVHALTTIQKYVDALRADVAVMIEALRVHRAETHGNDHPADVKLYRVLANPNPGQALLDELSLEKEHNRLNVLGWDLQVKDLTAERDTLVAENAEALSRIQLLNQEACRASSDRASLQCRVDRAEAENARLKDQVQIERAKCQGAYEAGASDLH